MNNINMENTKKGNLYNYIFLFVIFSALGYIYETILVIIRVGNYQSIQGILFGPFVPVYGIGAALFAIYGNYSLNNKKSFKHVFNSFIITGIIGALLEFIYSYVQEKIFGTVSWEYREYFMNFNGRTSIIHVVFWGFLGAIYINLIYPYILRIIQKIDKKVYIILNWIFIIFFIINVIFSIKVSLRQNERIKNIPPKDYTDYFLDKNFPDFVLDKKYSNHKRKN